MNLIVINSSLTFSTPCRLGSCPNLFLGKHSFSPSQNTSDHRYVCITCLQKNHFVSGRKYCFMYIISRMHLFNRHDNRVLLQSPPPHTHTLVALLRYNWYTKTCTYLRFFQLYFLINRSFFLNSFVNESTTLHSSRNIKLWFFSAKV